MLRQGFHDLSERGVIGDWCFINEDAYICFWHPSVRNVERGDISVIPIKPEPQRPDGPVWTWDGNREAPTITPSVRVLGGEGNPDEWHGWLTAGKIVNA